MGGEVGQTSQYAPAVIYDGGSSQAYNGTSYPYHMIFCSQDASNRLLYVSSRDGKNWNAPARLSGQVVGDTTGSSPAIALSQEPSFTAPYPNAPQPWYKPNYLVAVYKANDPTNRILYSYLDLNEDPSSAGWNDGGQVNTESAKWIFALGGQGSRTVTLYYLSNDPSNRILWTQFTPG